MQIRTLGPEQQVSVLGLGCLGMSQSHGPRPGDRVADAAALPLSADERAEPDAAHLRLVER